MPISQRFHLANNRIYFRNDLEAGEKDSITLHL